MKDISKIRQAHEQPLCAREWGWKYHHMGIPTDQMMPNEEYLPHLKIYVSGFETNPFGIEWMRYEKDCPIAQIIQSVPHIAFEVDDIDEEFAKHDFEIIAQPGAPADGIRAAMILYDGAPVELIEFKKSK